MTLKPQFQSLKPTAAEDDMPASFDESVAVFANYAIENQWIRKTKADNWVVGLNLTLSAGAFALICRKHPEAHKYAFQTFMPHALEFDTSKFDAALRAHLRALTPPAKQVDLSTLQFNRMITTPTSQLQYIWTINDKDQSFLYDPIRNLQHPYSYENLERRLKELMPDEQRMQWYETNRIDCFAEYRPDRPEKIIDLKDEERVVFNTYQKPQWMDGWVPEPTEPPVMYREMIEASIRGVESQRAVEQWLRDAIFTRAKTIMVMRAVPGAGKNTIAEYFLGPMVGQTNHGKATHKFSSSTYHKAVGRAKVYMLDETYLTGDVKEILKAYHNDTASLEEKYEKQSGRQTMFASFILCNNYKHKIKLDYNDRKFFVPDMGEAKLDDVLGKPRVEEMYLAFKDPQFLRQCASYLYTAYPEGKSDIFPKTESFKELSLLSYPSPMRWLIAAAKSKQVVKYGEFKSQFKGTDIFTLNDYLDHYAQNYGHTLGNMDDPTDGRWTFTSNVCKTEPPKENETDYRNGSGKHRVVEKSPLDLLKDSESYMVKQ